MDWKPPQERALMGVKPTPRLKLGERVRVMADCERREVNALGEVVRLRRSDRAVWIALEKRSEKRGVHPFPEDDHRGTHVLAWPDDCERLD